MIEALDSGRQEEFAARTGTKHGLATLEPSTDPAGPHCTASDFRAIMRRRPSRQIAAPRTAAAMETIVGQTVSHYAFLEKLGSGGMGDIYKARDSRLNRIVAVKVLSPGRTRDPQRRRRFIQEAQAASALNHPNIITIHDILPEGDTQYMVMEHVAGETLHQMIVAGRLSVAQVLQIATQMANALAAAHAAGIIHRDFKPANVMVTSSGLVKILDFGLAKLMDPTARLRSPSDDSAQTEDPATLTAAPLTVEGSIMGTVNYMSPEQAEGLKVDARSDIFSFGAVLYEMVTGQRAFDGDSGISTLSAVLRDEVKPTRELAPEVPAELDELIARCLRKNPDDRWQSMGEVAAALLKIRPRPDAAPAPAPASITPPPAPMLAIASKPGHKKLWLLGGAVALVALATGGVWWQTHRQVASPTPAPAVTVAVPTTPQPAPQQTVVPESGSPSNSNTSNDAASQIPTAAPPPPSTPSVPLATNTKPLPPPPVATRNTPAKPQTAAAPAPSLPVPPAPHAPAPAEVVAVTLTDGLPFRIALMEDVPLDTEVGHTIHFRVLEDLQGGPVTVIAKGAIVTGAVAALGGKRNFFGERKKAMFRLISTQSVDDGKIELRATPAARNDGAETRPFATPNESAHDLKDKNLIAASGTEYIAYISGEQIVNVHK